MKKLCLFDKWNTQKKVLNKKKLYFKEQDIFWAKLGINVGDEQNGKNDNFLRPVIIVKKFNDHLAFCIPLTSQKKEGVFYYSFRLMSQKIENSAILSQARLLDTSRFSHKLGRISFDDFIKLKENFSNLLKL